MRHYEVTVYEVTTTPATPEYEALIARMAGMSVERLRELGGVKTTVTHERCARHECDALDPWCAVKDWADEITTEEAS